MAFSPDVSSPPHPTLPKSSAPATPAPPSLKNSRRLTTLFAIDMPSSLFSSTRSSHPLPPFLACGIRSEGSRSSKESRHAREDSEAQAWPSPSRTYRTASQLLPPLVAAHPPIIRHHTSRVQN